MSNPSTPIPTEGTDPPAAAQPRWQQVGPNLVRITVPGGWLYAPSGALYADFAGTHTFVPAPAEAASLAPAIGFYDSTPHHSFLPRPDDPAGIVATEIAEGGRMIWTRGDGAMLASLCRAIIDHAGLTRDFTAWAKGEPTGEDA